MPYVFTQSLNREKPSDSTISVDTITMQERFRGALLGLVLVPTAVSLALTDSRAGGRKTAAVVEMEKAIARALAQLSHFLSTGSLSLESSNSTSATWVDVLPVLLRYCDQSVRTRRNLCSIESKAVEPETSSEKTAQAWLIGDILSQVMSAQPLSKPWVAQQRKRSIQSVDSSAVAQHYQVLCELALADDSGLFAHKGCNYGLCVSISARGMAAQTGWEAPLIAGLISGATVGYSALPLLWQQRMCHRANTECLLLADTLFYQWAGIAGPDSVVSNRAPTIIKR